MMRISQWLGLISAVLTAITPIAARAQGTFPSRPITVIVPAPPGGLVDLSVRLVSDGLSKALGQPVVVETRAGASGNPQMAAVARAAPDGHTLLASYSMFHVGNPAMFSKTGWHPIDDFAAVANLTIAPHLVMINPNVPARTLSEFIDYARGRPGTLNYASGGNGSMQHVGAELFKQLTRTDIVHIPYKGSGPAMADLVGGQVQLLLTTPPAAVGFVQNGRARALALASAQRHPLLPDVPTTAEAGLPGLVLDAWIALFAPAGTPREVVDRISAETRRILELPETIAKAEKLGAYARFMTPAELDAMLRRDLESWGRVIRSSGIRAD